MKLSIITAIHNSLAMNRLYWKCLSENTTSPFELIVIDNHSTDGSETFFRSLAETTRGTKTEVIYYRNEKNQSYPASQNQGMRAARNEILAFLNNDIWLPKGWNEPFERELEKNPLLALSPSGQEAQPYQLFSNRLKRKWRWITELSRIWRLLAGASEEERLWKSLEWMYGSLADFRNPTPSTPNGYFHALKGDSILFRKRLLETLPEPWDETVEASDWHLYLSIAKAHEMNTNIPLPRVLCDVYIHHFGRYSSHQKFEPLDLKSPFRKIEEIWSTDEIKRLWWGNSLPDRP